MRIIVLLGFFLVLAPALARAQVSDSLVLKWTAPSDPGEGAVSRYDVRFATAPITSANFDSAVVIPSQAPGAPGTVEHAVVRGFSPGHSYWFAIRSADLAGNWSALSNVVRWDYPLAAAPPAAPSGLAAGMPSGGGLPLHWTPGAEPGLAGYHVWRTLDPAAAWSSLGGGLVHDTAFVDTDLPAGVSRLWYAVSAVDLVGNESARSAALAIVLRSPNVSLPPAVELAQNTPNPFVISTSIRYALPKRAVVSLVVYSVRGERVATLAQGVQEPGYHVAVLDAGRLADGVYFYRLEVEGVVRLRKVILLR